MSSCVVYSGNSLEIGIRHLVTNMLNIRLTSLVVAVVAMMVFMVACGSESAVPEPAADPTTAPAAPAAPTTAPAVAVAQDTATPTSVPVAEPTTPPAPAATAVVPSSPAPSPPTPPVAPTATAMSGAAAASTPASMPSPTARPCAHDRTRDASSGSADSRARDISSGSAYSRARSGCADRYHGTSAYRSAAYRNSNTAPIAHSRAADIHAGAAHVYTCANRYHGARRDRQGRQQGW